MKKIHWKSFLVGMLAVILVVGLSLPVLGASGVWQTWEVMVGGYNLVVDGQTIQPQDQYGNPVEIVNYNGTTYLPLRTVGKALGKEVDWDGETRTVYLGAKPAQQSGWVMIYEKATQTEDYESPSGIYFDTYSWEKDEEKGLIRAYSTNEAKPDDSTRHYQCTQFETTCTLPPKSGAPGEKVLFDISAALVETISDQYYFGANCTVQWAAPGKEPNIAGRLCYNVLDEGADWTYNPAGADASVGGGSVNPGSSCTVYWIFPQNPQPGDQISVYFMTNAVQIEWCYEYQG